MSIEERTGDLFAQPDLTALAHGCNCAGAMGKGIAPVFKQRWPKMFREYKARCADGRFGVGDVFVWRDGATTVFNLGIKDHWRDDARLEYIERSVAAMAREASALGVTRVGLPRIGAGLGKLAWADVRAALERVTAGTGLTLVVVSLPGA